MKLRKPLTIASSCLILLVLLVTVGLADTIRLRDGSVLKGKVISYNQRQFTILVYIGGTSSRHVIPVDDVESVEFDASGTVAGGVGGPVEVPVTTEQGVAKVETPQATSVPIPSQPVGVESAPAPVSPPVSEPAAGSGDSGLIPVIAEKTVSVAAAADWTSTEIRVQRGQRIVISASGEVDLGDNKRTGPDGLELSDSRKLIPNRTTGSLIAVVGDDNDDFIFIGASSEFVAPHNGILFLSVNEGNLRDNNGAFVARVKVLSNR